MTPRSPRRPLAELDQSQLSQRLFHSPSLTGPASLSPSLLLTSQLPPSVERMHRHTERQLTELKAQMQELAVSTGHRDHFSQQKRMALEQERDQLEALLEEKELQTEALKKYEDLVKSNELPKPQPSVQCGSETLWDII